MSDDPHPTHEWYVQRQRARAVQLARQILAQEVGVLEAARELSRMRGLVDVSADDPDFRAFVVIDSETDHLPIGSERELWQPEALARKEPDISEAEAWARDIAEKACRGIINRFAVA